MQFINCFKRNSCHTNLRFNKNKLIYTQTYFLLSKFNMIPITNPRPELERQK